MSASPPLLTALGTRAGNEAAIVYIHGFSGDPEKTWGDFPRLVAEGGDGPLDGWDRYSLGYATALSLDIRGIWSADPQIAILAKLLGTTAANSLKAYKSLALVAHSMGGLVVQRALVDDADLAGRVGHVFLFGTPSAGLKKAFYLRFLKRQFEDMALESDFIKDLRARWRDRFTDPPFKFWAVAGASDDFVPWTSSIEPFPEAQRAVIPGDHLAIVKPKDAQHLGVRLVRNGLIGDASPAGPWNAARVAVQQREFHRAVGLLWPNQDKIDDDALVQLALALDEVGRRQDAIKALTARPELGTDAMGVLGGRLKRRWLAERVKEDAEKALDLYSRGLAESEAAIPRDPNYSHKQAFYHGINVAFFLAVYKNDLPAARAMAGRVLEHCARATGEAPWKPATEGDAHLILGETERALDGYRRFVSDGHPPRELSSAYQQATILADHLGDNVAEEKLPEIFHGPGEGGGE